MFYIIIYSVCMHNKCVHVHVDVECDIVGIIGISDSKMVE